MDKEVFDIYQTLCGQYSSASIAEASDASTRVAAHKELMAFTQKLMEEHHDCLYELLRLHLNNNDLINLDLLAEITRGYGYFYGDYKPVYGNILPLMLTKATQLLEDKEAANNNWRIMSYVSTIYDIFFHQIRLEEGYPPVCAVLYFQLSYRILDPEWTPLYRSNEGYSQSIYFLEMAVYWFRTREEEFWILWQKIEFLINTRQGMPWENRYWPEACRELLGGPDPEQAAD